MGKLRDWPAVGFFIPSYRHGDPSEAMVWLERLRVVGMAATYMVIVMYGTFGVGDLLPLLQGHVVDTAIGTPAMVLGMAVLVVVAKPGERRGTLSSLGVPTGRIAVLLGGYAVTAFIAVQITGVEPSGGVLARLVLSVLGLVLGLFLIIVVVPTALLFGYLAVRYWCVAADGHPMLPALITLIYAAIQLGLFLVEGGLAVLPPGLRVAVGIGGPLCLAAIAVVELRLHHETGVSVRSLPRRRTGRR